MHDFFELFSQDGPAVFSNICHADERGTFEMVYEKLRILKKYPNLPELMQVNVITGVRYSVRGFHGSREENNHWKIVSCLQGEIKDFVLDVRVNSKTFGEVAEIEINEDDHKLLVIPPGFAHAVQSLSDRTLCVYATNIPYRDNKEFSISPIDPKWKGLWGDHLILSNRDKEAPLFADYVSESSDDGFTKN
jgi:dTDP-4-dehydrorhamnose 3,5-epimerase